MSKKYKIGQVLYIISPKNQTVIPVQIQEINQRTTIEGQEIIYMIMDPDGQGPHNLEEINGQIFINSSDVAKILKANASKAIDAMIANASNIAKEKFGSSGGADNLFPTVKKKKTPPLLPPPQVIEEDIEDDIDEVEVVGPDGKTHIQKQKVRIHMPDEISAATG